LLKNPLSQLGKSPLFNYDRAWLRGDLLAGITVAAYLVPQCMAYGELAGLQPVAGLWAILPPLLIYAFWGSSPQLSVGPESGSALLTAAAIAPLVLQGGNGASLAAVLALLVGSFCAIGYVARLGFISNLLSRPLLVGYMSGVSVIMLVGQLGNITGLTVQAETVLGAVVVVVGNLRNCHWPTAMLAGFVLAFLYGTQRWVPKAPGPLLAVLLATIAVVTLHLEQFGVALVGNIPAGLPQPIWPSASWSEVKALLPSALGIALVGYSDNVLTARAFASRNDYEVVADRELLALGLCNLGNGLMQGFPISSSGSRTALGESLGSKTQLYSLVAAVGTIGVLLFLRPVLALFPKAALGAIIIYAASRLIDIPEFVRLYQLRRRDCALAIATASGVILLDITSGVLLAVLLSIAELVWRLSNPTEEIQIKDCELIYRYDAPLCFTNAEHFRGRIRRLLMSHSELEKIVIEGGGIGSIDTTATAMLEELRAELALQKIHLEFHNLRPQVKTLLQRNNLV
jgi:sulfate permease, SulP family